MDDKDSILAQLKKAHKQKTTIPSASAPDSASGPDSSSAPDSTSDGMDTTFVSNPKRKPKLSDDAVDGIAALVMIILVVSAAAYWLHNMP